MSSRLPSLRLLAVASVAAAVACQDAAAPTSSTTPLTLQGAQVQAPDPDALARTIPGFGGMFLQNGRPTVYLTDLAQRAAVEAALGGYVRSGGLRPGDIQLLRGRFTWTQLSRWFRQVSNEAFEPGGVVFVDLDEAANRVLVGVENATGAASARSIAARLGLPDAAVEVRQVEPIEYAATLRDQVRPVVAGLQINFGQYVCSIGFNATSGGQASFVTASHCTNRQGGTEGTLYYQPLSSTANSFIGTEVDDPQYFRGGPCPKGRKCRYSDASRAAYDAGVSYTLGGIARTNAPNNRSITITGNFSVTGEGNALVGSTANKVGRTTGWTQGVVTNTCVDTGVQGSNIVQLCQTFVSAGVGGGDSGSDVFALAGSSSVTLLGVLWGGNSSGTQFVYSPIANVEQELGPLTTH